MKGNSNEVFELLNLYGSSDINLYECGLQQCSPGYMLRPCLVRSVNVIHFIVSGRGQLFIGNRTFQLEAGQGFFSPANMPVNYQADFDDPWLYCWIHFNGVKLDEYLRSVSISPRTPVFRYANPRKAYDGIMEMMRLAAEHAPSCSPRIFSICLELFATLIDDNASRRSAACAHDYSREAYIERALSYMELHLTQNINITEIAGALGLNPNYFSTIFRQIVGCTPQSHLITRRLQYACTLLLDTNTSIKGIAQTIGYSHAASFSKAFTKQYGITPSEYRIAGHRSAREKPPTDPAAMITKRIDWK